MTALLPLEYSSEQDLLKKLHPHVDGVILRIIIGVPHSFRRCGSSCLTRGVFSHPCQKMGVQANYWRETKLQIHVYRVEDFTK
ncbi:MAG: hypothetical protein IPO22_14695 [Anaerolineales bacterium]|nr:hypothetical protein [Anaerolineales bacterium]